jgi:HEAT repeat protein
MGSLALLALAWGAGAALARAPKPDPVEALRQALLASYAEPAERDQAIRASLGSLKTLGDLRRAIALPEWRDGYPDEAVAKVDGAHRRALREWFAESVRQVLGRGDEAAAGEMMNLLAEMAREPRGPGSEMARQLAPDVARWGRQGTPRVRLAAARTLGLLKPDATVAGPALEELLRSPGPDLRRAAAEALTGLLQEVALSATSPVPGQPPRTSRSEVARALLALLPALGHGLGDWQIDVRRRCAAGLDQAAQTFIGLIPEPAGLAEEEEPRQAPTPRVDARSELRPLVLGLRDQGTALARAVRDSDTEVRLVAQRTLEDLAKARLRWLRLVSATPGGNEGQSVPVDDPLAEGLRAALPNLAAGVADPEVRIRRAAIDVLEVLGPLATTAAPALARALNDPDRFVRWSAARTLGTLGPGVARVALPGLSRMLEDQDPDLRLVAANALARLNPGAQIVRTAKGPHGTGRGETALPALVRSMRSSDPALRIAALRTIQGMGSVAGSAVPALREALADPDPRVRQAAAEALGGLGPVARDATDDLRKAIADSSPDVRRAASDALLNVVR